jgi:DNA-binding CsgD family transcriptional regulator
MSGRIFIILVLAVQGLSTLYLVTGILSSLVGLPVPALDWQLVELFEVLAAIGLLMGLVLGAFALRRAIRDKTLAEERLRRASGAFMELLVERFAEWGLSPAESDVALFALKGMSTAEISGLRATSEGTVKAQTNAIYRKAGVTGRSQLMSVFIEDLMTDVPKNGSIHRVKL